ncbi:MAG: M28 family peptidase, partial [Cyclobacteriaceae bacterium]
MKSRIAGLLLLLSAFSFAAFAQVPPQFDLRMYDIVKAASPDRLQTDVQKLVDFGTRHTLSDTVSQTRGIGAARRWIKGEFDKISGECGDCLEVSFHRTFVKEGDNSRIVKDVEIVNVIAIQRGTEFPDRYIIMSGDIDSRVSDNTNYTDDSPGANDNASGMAGAIEAARILTKYKFPTSVIYVGLSGEEQGLYGGKFMAQMAKEEGWDIVGVINNDMIGNIEGIDGVIDNRSFRIFSEPTPVTEPDSVRLRRRF